MRGRRLRLSSLGVPGSESYCAPPNKGLFLNCSRSSYLKSFSPRGGVEDAKVPLDRAAGEFPGVFTPPAAAAVCFSYNDKRDTRFCCRRFGRLQCSCCPRSFDTGLDRTTPRPPKRLVQDHSTGHPVVRGGS